jgi:hypothetical protein
MDAPGGPGEATALESAAASHAVTVDNFNRAESDKYFAQTVEAAGGIGRFFHRRELEPADRQVVIRTNRDTLYSAAVLDLDAGPASITLPDAGHRFRSLIAIDEDQYVVGVYYDAGSYTFSRDTTKTRYVLLGVRTFVDPADSDDLEQAHALQNAVEVKQASPGKLDLPDWEQESQRTVRDALLKLAATVPDTRRMFGSRGQVDPVRHLIGTATGWGGNPEQDATYLTVTPKRNDGTTVHRLTVGDVPVDAFWSITVYNAAGFLEPNEQDAYSINNVTAKRDADGSVTIQFGRLSDEALNWLPITPGWNYWVRLYRPRAEILDGSWAFPEAHAREDAH